ncbi:mitochondrial import receptor subunit Tom22 [Elasticomyces elasticus]|nr:mitochondrial import receptor subunit Tom22 [Elasticomyces elasticus]
MVKLEEVIDEEFTRSQPGPDAEDDWDTDSDSEISDSESDFIPDETLADRISALQDIIPPQQRKFLSSTLSTATSWLQTGIRYGGKTLWVVSTSALLLGVPWALAFAEEQQMQEMEREMRAQQGANEVRD